MVARLLGMSGLNELGMSWNRAREGWMGGTGLGEWTANEAAETLNCSMPIANAGKLSPTNPCSTM